MEGSIFAKVSIYSFINDEIKFYRITFLFFRREAFLNTYFKAILHIFSSDKHCFVLIHQLPCSVVIAFLFISHWKRDNYEIVSLKRILRASLLWITLKIFSSCVVREVPYTFTSRKYDTYLQKLSYFITFLGTSVY